MTTTDINQKIASIAVLISRPPTPDTGEWTAITGNEHGAALGFHYTSKRPSRVRLQPSKEAIVWQVPGAELLMQ